jgi:hypothetical protein
MVGEPWLGSSAGLQIVVWEVSQDVYSHCHCLDGVQNYLCLLGKNVSTSNPKCEISCTEYSLSLYQFFFARGGRAGWSCEGERKANAGTSPLVGLGGWFSRQNSGTICCGIALAGFLGVEVTKKLIHSSSYISESHQTTNIADSQIALPAHPKQPSTLKSYKMI